MRLEGKGDQGGLVGLVVGVRPGERTRPHICHNYLPHISHKYVGIYFHKYVGIHFHKYVAIYPKASVYPQIGLIFCLLILTRSEKLKYLFRSLSTEGF